MAEESPERTWKEFFDAHAPRYLENAFTAHTQDEVNFLLTLFPLKAGARVLDVGCGVGRHSIELARRGFSVVGVDVSAGMLAEARRASEGMAVEWVEADAARGLPAGPFDLAICLCEGGLGLLNADEDAEEHDGAILRNVCGALAGGAPFVVTALNGYASIRQMTDDAVAKGSFDPATMRAVYLDEWSLPEGRTEMVIRERLFIPPEMTRLLVESGFEVLAVYGGTAGQWGRRALLLDEVEAMYVCRKA